MLRHISTIPYSLHSSLNLWMNEWILAGCCHHYAYCYFIIIIPIVISFDCQCGHAVTLAEVIRHHCHCISSSVLRVVRQVVRLLFLPSYWAALLASRSTSSTPDRRHPPSQYFIMQYSTFVLRSLLCRCNANCMGVNLSCIIEHYQEIVEDSQYGER